MDYPPNQPSSTPLPVNPYQQQPQYQQQQYAQPQQSMNTVVNVQVQQGRTGPGLFIRTLYFICIGWWLGFFWLQFGFLLCVFVVTLPVGLLMLNRVPAVLTLRPASRTTQTNVQVATQMNAGTPLAPAAFAQTVNVAVTTSGTQQTSFLIRAVYFVLVGWWVGWLWANAAYLFCVLIVTLPVGLMMFNRLPAVLTLRKN